MLCFLRTRQAAVKFPLHKILVVSPGRGAAITIAYELPFSVLQADGFTWDFRLGSRMIVGWKNWLGTDYEFYNDPVKYPTYMDNVHQVFSTPHGNEVTVRFIYFLNYNQFSKK